MAVNTYQLSITGNCAGQFVQNLFHYKMEDSGYTTALGAAKGLVDGWLADGKAGNWVDLCPANYTMKSIKCRRVSGGIGPEWIDLSQDGETGDRTGDSQTSSCGPVLVWVIEGSFKRKGRTFVPGISITDADAGEITSSALAAFKSAANAYMGEFEAVDGGTPDVTMVVAQSNNLALTHEIIDVLVSINIGVQRRRQLPV